MADAHRPHSTGNLMCSSEIQVGEGDVSTDTYSGEKFCETVAATGGEHQLETEGRTPQLAAHHVLLEPSARDICEQLSSSGPHGVTYVPYESELQLPHIMRLMKADLSEPYSIYTYRYFIHNWPNLCFLVNINSSLPRLPFCYSTSKPGQHSCSGVCTQLIPGSPYAAPETTLVLI